MTEKSIIFKGHNITIKVNQRYNRLKIDDLFVLEGRLYGKCICDCGSVVEKVLVRSLLTGNTKSCGCLNKELFIDRNYKHGGSIRENKQRLYNIWVDMRRRCNNPNRKGSENYNKKGIRVCEEWNDFSVFKKWALENGYEADLTIERKNNLIGYNPENCCWVLKSEQSKNRDSNHYITFGEETKTLTEWARTTGIKRTTIASRLSRGWTVEKALTTY